MVALRHRPVGFEEPQQLGHVEGVAVGSGMHGPGQVSRGLGADGVGDEQGSFLLADPAQPDALDHRLAGERRHGRHQRVVDVDVHVAVRAHHEQAGVVQSGSQDGQQLHGRGVGPMKVVEDHDEAPRPGDVAQVGRQVLA